MKTLKFNLFSSLFLVISLLAGLFLSSPVAAVSPDKAIPADVLAAPGPLSLSLLTVPEVPAGVGSPKANGTCDPATEYSGALAVTFPDGLGGTGTGHLYLIHDANYLYMCILSPMGSRSDRFHSLYLDPQGDGSATPFAQANDFSLRLTDTTNLQSTFRGNGLANGWQDTSATDNSLWTGASTTGNFDTAEYSLPLANFGLNVCSSVFRLAGYHHWLASVGNDYGWPAAQYYDQPGTWQPLQLGSANCGQNGNIAYVFRSNAEDATSFFNLLTAAGYTVTQVKLSDVLTTNFSVFGLTIIADDTGSLDQWGTPTLTDAQVAQIKLPNKPILGLGEGGYSFFGRLSLFIGWPRGWHGPQNIMSMAPTAPAGFFNPPISPVTHYSAPFNSVGIYLPPNQSLPGDVTPIGMEDPPDDHSSLIAQSCRTLWGNSGNPLILTPDGKLLFLHTVSAVYGSQCPTEAPPDVKCREVIKEALPPNGTPVVPGQVITYTLTYTYSSDKACNNSGDAKIVDSIPIDTTYVPNSASDGLSPGADGALTWSVPPASSPGIKTFKVIVSDTQCANQRMVNNRASLLAYGYGPVDSNVVSHPVTCPPVGFPNTQPSYAEDELQVQPYPLMVGSPSEVSVRLTNSGLSAAAVTVQFQVSPNGIGIGLPYSTFDTRSVTIPATSQIILKTTYFPPASGLACFQVVVTSPGYTAIKTQTCLDTIEDFSGSPPYPPLNFQVGNPTAAMATIQLVVDNTCPGWSAVISTPAGGVLTDVGPNSGDLRSASLQVTPPSPVLLGSGCHIDVQGWIVPVDGTPVLIGGIRKLDIPPVHLPANVIPPWEEPEITFMPNPPLAGVSGLICIRLQNPLGVPKVVTVNFSVADFGAGVGFTPVASITNVTLPPYSINELCPSWTPGVGGTLHRCVLATLVQAGTLDQHSQKNIDIVRPIPGSPGGMVIPFVAGNPGLADRLLSFELNMVGIDPYWHPQVTLPGGGPPPTMLLAGGSVPLVLRFTPATAPSGVLAPATYFFGDLSSVEVTELLDGVPESGFSVHLVPIHIYLPLVRR